MTITYGSVCSGIEAASVAWEPLGFRPLWFSEIEKFPCAVLAHRFPTVPNLGDMTAIAERVERGEVEAPDILVGGTPCQAFSVAGKRGSLSDERGNLSLAFVRLADAIDRRRGTLGLPPCIVVWENVPGVLSVADNAFGCFLAGLAGEDDPLVPAGKRWTNAGLVCGPERSVCWRVLDAQWFGVAQRRRRVFVVAGAGDFDTGAVLLEWEGVRRDSPPSREAREGASGDADGRAAFGGGRQSGSIDVGTSLTSKNQRNDFETETMVVAKTLRAQPSSSRRMDTDNYVAVPYDLFQVTPPLNRQSRKDGDPCHTLARVNAAHAAVVVPMVNMQGSKGNAVTQEDGPSFTLNAMHGHDVHAVVAPPVMRVRRLMPVECERLQGFPDGWALITYRGKPAADGPRYKAIGNSMAVPVMRWIGARLAARLSRPS